MINLGSGIHATIAGVLLALTIPARVRVDPPAFLTHARRLLQQFEGRTDDPSEVEERHAALWELEELTERAQAPMLRIEHTLQPWVAFLIVPLFALANAGVAIPANVGELLAEPVVLGVVAGLILGKQLGIMGATWLLVRMGLTELPDGVTWRHIYGVAWLGGIGFTMSLFIAELAYGPSPALILAKIGILGASLVAGLGGYLVLSLTERRRRSAGEPPVSGRADGAD